MTSHRHVDRLPWVEQDPGFQQARVGQGEQGASWGEVLAELNRSLDHRSTERSADDRVGEAAASESSLGTGRIASSRRQADRILGIVEALLG
jgi:hypothetical protein